jgi:hypothetical protein
MLVRMKRICFAMALVAASAGCGWGQDSCSKSAEGARAATVATVRQQLRAVRVTEEADTNVPVAAQSLIPQLKAALAETAQAVLACHAGAVDPKTVEGEIAALLKANPPQPPGDSVMNGDPRYTEYLSEEYSSNLLVSIATPQPKLLSVQFQFNIECGYDTVWMLFEQDGSEWREKLLWQAPPYTEISGAFGDFFLTTILPAGSSGAWHVIAAHGTPWCTSRFSGFKMDLLQPVSGSTVPKVVWSAERGYSRQDYVTRLRATTDGFELRTNAVALDINGYERNVIYHYRVAGGQVTRVEPIAANGRGFVEEWLSMPWDEAKGQTSPEAVAGMKMVHDRIENADKDSKTYVSWTYGPVRACLMKGRYEVEMDADPGGPEFYAIAETGNGYTMMNYGTTQDERCSGPDLMKAK